MSLSKVASIFRPSCVGSGVPAGSCVGGMPPWARQARGGPLVVPSGWVQAPPPRACVRDSLRSAALAASLSSFWAGLAPVLVTSKGLTPVLVTSKGLTPVLVTSKVHASASCALSGCPQSCCSSPLDPLPPCLPRSAPRCSRTCSFEAGVHAPLRLVGVSNLLSF